MSNKVIFWSIATST